jgi:alkylhydroperoxidase family enzyme
VATIKLWTDEEAAIVPDVKTVFDDIRATRKSDFVNNFWRALANQPLLLERTWSSVKQVMMEPGVLLESHARRRFTNLLRASC